MGFSGKLINWYKANKRDLPWRNTNDPYVIWLSEVILQQTRVDQGLSYFNSFIENYPTVQDLANAKEDEVLKLWQGLGYYSRARNLHYTAKTIVNDYNGKFPKDFKAILSLKGVGEYTAAAIASFSYNQSYPVIDGNVYRVLSRIFGIKTPIDSTKGNKEFKYIAAELIDKKRPSDYNQAIMEFGALQCTPKSPNCQVCIFKLECVAFKTNKVDALPKKEKKIKQRDRYFNYLVIKEKGNIYLKQRITNDIWQGLYDFPLIETNNAIEEFSDILKSSTTKFDSNFKVINKSKTYKHILSHQKIYATFWMVETLDSKLIKESSKKIPIEKIHKYAVPKLIENYINTIV